jgi:hypothetical protein
MARNEINRRQFVKSAAAGVGAAGAMVRGASAQSDREERSVAEQGGPERPNIVFFMVDQLSAKWLEAVLRAQSDAGEVRCRGCAGEIAHGAISG